MLDLIPLIPTYALSLVSLLCSAFVIVKILLPVLPPHPFSGRVSPSEFGLPTFRSLSVAHKTHLWLAACDVTALAFWLWQVGAENAQMSAVAGVAHDAGSAVRFAVALTLRQTCLAVVVLVTLVHVRMGHSVSLGKIHWHIWLPTICAVIGCVMFAGFLAAGRIGSLFPGLLAYITTLTVASTSIFGYLILTLIAIHRHLTATFDTPPAERKPRASFATEDVDALRDGSSWVTSDDGSKRSSVVSSWSFSTWHSPLPSTNGSMRDPRMTSDPSLAPKKSSFWFNTTGGDEIPPVPRIPSPYRQDESAVTTPTVVGGRFDQRLPRSSQESWVTSRDGSEITISEFSFPTTRAASPPLSPEYDREDVAEIERLPRSSRTAVSHMQSSTQPSRMINAKVLGGYGHVGLSEKLSTATAGANPNKVFKISYAQIWLWLAMIWIPFILALPGLIYGILGPNVTSPIPPVFLAISVAISSPLLALNVVVRAGLPMPTNLFPSKRNNQIHPHPYGNTTLPGGLTSASDSMDKLRKGMSTSTLTVVEGRRSGDVWMMKGDAVEGKSRLGRALSMLQPSPPLSVLPTHPTEDNTPEFTPPVPLRMDDSYPSTPQSANSAEVGKRFYGTASSKVSTFHSALEGSILGSVNVVSAEKFSASQATPVTYTSPPRGIQHMDHVYETPKNYARPHQHLRSRSVSSTQSGQSHREPLTPPPAMPLPPIPQANGDAYRNVTERHKRSASTGHSTGYSFSPITNVPEIDALSAGMLPILVPGVSIGSNVNVRGFNSSSKQNVPATAASSSFSSPEVHSTPAARTQRPVKKKKHHFSLPSLSLRKDQAFRLWRSDTTRALNDTVHRNSISRHSRRNTVSSDMISPGALEDEEVDELGQTAHSEDRRAHRRMSSVSVYSDDAKSARDSLATLLNILDTELPRSTTPISAITLVEPGANDSDDGHIYRPDSRRGQNDENHVPAFHLPSSQRNQRRKSNIPYIKTDENDVYSTTRTRPSNPKYVPKHVMSPITEGDTQTPTKIRPLSLLQDRDMNIPTTGSNNLKGNSFSFTTTSPLSVKKANRDRNSGSAGIKPLVLNRSETTKARGVLRRTEILPRLIVRPPSGNDHDLEVVLR